MTHVFGGLCCSLFISLVFSLPMICWATAGGSLCFAFDCLLIFQCSMLLSYGSISHFLVVCYALNKADAGSSGNICHDAHISTSVTVK